MAVNPKVYTLSLEFDLRQVSTALRYDIKYENQSVLQQFGQRAGCYLLDKDSLVEVVITVYYGASMQPVDIVVRDLILISMPGGNPHQQQLSPFALSTAGIILNDWDRLEVTDVAVGVGSVQDQTVSVTMAPKTLTVIDADGMWQLSGYVSAQAFDVAPGADLTRVYSFDPTVIVGTGGDDLIGRPGA